MSLRMTAVIVAGTVMLTPIMGYGISKLASAAVESNINSTTNLAKTLKNDQRLTNLEACKRSVDSYFPERSNGLEIRERAKSECLKNISAKVRAVFGNDIKIKANSIRIA